MRLTFLGHACFLIESGSVRLLTDPFSSQIGYAPVDTEADVVTLSHHNPKWHSCLDDVRGEFEVFDALGDGSMTLDGVKLEAVRVWEKSPDGSAEDDQPVAMIKIVADGLHVLHGGDLGHSLTEQQRAACGKVDVLLAPAGGFPTISQADAAAMAEQLGAKIVIPMHYGVPGLAMKLLPRADLEALWPEQQLVRHGGSTLDTESFNIESLPNTVQLHLLEPLRLA